MSVSIKYKGNTIASASTEVTKTIKTAGKYCEADILVENTPDGGDAPVINPLSVTANGTYTAPSGVDGYSPINVNVPQGITPTGNINITDTNVTDVTNYATAQVVDADLVAENIKKDVNILGIVGSFEGGGGWLLDVQQYTHAEDWTTDALGNSLNFAQTYLEYQQSGKYPFQIAYIENNTVKGNYKAKLVIYYRSITGTNVATSGRGDNTQWGSIEASRSFYISAGAKITVLTLYHGEGW